MSQFVVRTVSLPSLSEGRDFRNGNDETIPRAGIQISKGHIGELLLIKSSRYIYKRFVGLMKCER